jgi:lipopolysaccharide export system protein LptA
LIGTFGAVLMASAAAAQTAPVTAAIPETVAPAAAAAAGAPAGAPAAHGAPAHKPPIAGLNYDSSKPIQVNSDTFSADLNAETGTYRGNVIVVQGDMKLHADEVRVLAPDGKARRMEAHGHVVVDSPSGSAIGEEGVYDVVARVIHLTGHVVLTKGQNVMRGSALDVAMATGEAHLIAVGEHGAPARVQGVFIPQQTTAAHPKPAATAPQTPHNP